MNEPADAPTHRTHPSHRRTGHGSTHARIDGYADGIEREGDEIGNYKLLTELGAGGFGTVWLAKRICDFEQKVAIKIVKQGLDSDTVMERFGQEVQLLALMDHPHVAKVFDAGMTASGRPYFVMDHVDGRPLTKFADEGIINPKSNTPRCPSFLLTILVGWFNFDLLKVQFCTAWDR